MISLSLIHNVEGTVRVLSTPDKRLSWLLAWSCVYTCSIEHWNLPLPPFVAATSIFHRIEAFLDLNGSQIARDTPLFSTSFRTVTRLRWLITAYVPSKQRLTWCSSLGKQPKSTDMMPLVVSNPQATRNVTGVPLGKELQ